MKWIGLTGGIACGKSTVSQMLRDRAIPVIDADEVAREVVLPGSPGLKAVINEFGKDLLLEDGALNRRALGQRVFGHPDRLHVLEALLHPLIRERIRERKEVLKNSGASVAVYDIPLLFETKAEEQFDAIVVISCTKEQQRERLRRKTDWSEDEIEMRIASQLPLNYKEQRASFVLQNNRDEQHLIKEFKKLLTWLESYK